MYPFSIPSRINPKSKKAKKFRNVGGAYINCWISFKDLDAAEKLARLLIREQGWIPTKDMKIWKIKKPELKTMRDKQYYSEALEYGYSLVIATWPKGS